MNLKILLLLILLPLIGSSQSKIYLNEKMKEISLQDFNKKCEHHIFKCHKFTTDSLEINKVLYKYSFGKIDKEAFKQIQMLLASQSKKPINPDETIIIKFTDSLKSIQTLKKNFDKHILNCPAYHNKKSLKDYQNDRDSWVTEKKKCFGKFKKNNTVNFNYVYKNADDLETIYSYKNFLWIKDRGVFKNLFFKIMDSKNLVILKPDGEYFLSGSHFDDKSISKLLKHNDWSKYKDDWFKSTTSHLKNGKGIFNNSYYSHSKHCF